MKFLKSKIVLALVPISIFLLFSCQPQRNIDDIKSQIASMNEKFAKAMVDKDFLSTMDMYTDDAISLPSYGKMLRGKEALKAQAEKDMNSPMNLTDFKINSTDVMLAGNNVIEIGTYTLTMIMPEMPEGMQDEGKYLTIYEFQPDGSLKIKVETWNTDINPWEMMEQMKPSEEMKMN